jgi:hypothetical protein
MSTETERPSTVLLFTANTQFNLKLSRPFKLKCVDAGTV